MSARIIDAEKVLAELAEGPDRAVAIVGGSLVEYALFTMLCHKLGLVEGSKRAEKLAEDRGPLATFDLKIRMAEALEIFVEHTSSNDVKLIKKIRNEFAHDMNLSGFEDQKVAKWISSMDHSQKVITGLSRRAQFVSAVSMITGLLIARAVADRSSGVAAGALLGDSKSA